MNETATKRGETQELLPHEIEADRRLEALLDDLAARTASAPPADFTRRVMEARGFAPWEVRSRSAWRVPVLAVSGLAAGTAGLALLPLWSLGPGTALQTWARVAFAVVSRPVELLTSFGPALSSAAQAVATALPQGALVTAGVATALSAFGLAWGLRGSRARRVRAEHSNP